MFVIPGKHKNSYLLAYNGFRYSRDFDSKYIFRCSTRSSTRCRGRLSFYIPVDEIDDFEDLGDDDVQVLGNHNHEPEKDIVLWSKMLEMMLEQCRNTTEPLKEIFNNVCRNFPEVASQHTYNSVRSKLDRARHGSRPKIPNTLSDLGKLLIDSNIPKNLIKSLVSTASGDSAIIFTTLHLLNGLDNAEDMFMDGTFSSTSTHPKMCQIYTMHYKYQNSYTAAIIVLMERRTTDSYNSVFDWIISQKPSLKDKNLQIMSDYEKATIKSLRRSFPKASIFGCFFHYCQAVIKKWQELGLSEPNEYLSMVMSVPLVPPEKFKDAEIYLQKETEELVKTYPKIAQFFNYLKKNWLKYPDHVSIANARNQTNDGPESFHRHSRERLGGRHPVIWQLLDGIEKVLLDEEINLKRLQLGHQSKRHTPMYILNRMAYIKRRQHELENGLPIGQFLKMFPRSFVELKASIQLFLSNGTNSSIDDVDPSLMDIAPKKIFTNNVEPLKTKIELMLPAKNCNPFSSLRNQDHCTTSGSINQLDFQYLEKVSADMEKKKYIHSWLQKKPSKRKRKGDTEKNSTTPEAMKRNDDKENGIDNNKYNILVEKSHYTIEFDGCEINYHRTQ